MSTEAGWLIGMIEDLVPVAANLNVSGDDGEEHGLEAAVDLSGEVSRWWCACGGWDTGRVDRIDVARGFLHHVYPSRYTARPSTIFTETLASIRQTTRTTDPLGA